MYLNRPIIHVKIIVDKIFFDWFFFPMEFFGNLTPKLIWIINGFLPSSLIFLHRPAMGLGLNPRRWIVHFRHLGLVARNWAALLQNNEYNHEWERSNKAKAMDGLEKGKESHEELTARRWDLNSMQGNSY